MLRIEIKFRSFVLRHLTSLCLMAVLLTGIFARAALIPFLSGDMTVFNIPWMRAIRKGEISPLIQNGAFNYAPLFLYLFKIASDLFASMDAGSLCKMLSLGMEVVTSLVCFFAVRRLRGHGRMPVAADVWLLAGIWLNPLLILNGAAWGQTDCFYAIFCVLAALLLSRDRPVWAMLCFAVAASWKLQAVLMLPLFILMYLCGRKRFSLLWFVLVPAVMLLTSLPMVRFAASPLQIFHTYAAQTNEHWARLVLNYPNLYALLGFEANENAGAASLLVPLGVAILAAVYVCAAGYMAGRRMTPMPAGVILLGAWCVLCCAFLLPRMHERYAFVGELLLLMAALTTLKPKLLLATTLCYFATMNAYLHYLVDVSIDSRVTALMQLIALALLTWECFCGGGMHEVSRSGAESTELEGTR